MSGQDIDTLDGAELDALVAERVMGWHLRTYANDSPRWYNSHGRHVATPSTFRPSFLHDREALDEALEQGWSVTFRQEPNYGPTTVTVSKDAVTVTCTARRKQAALCRALCKAIGAVAGLEV
jgi:hypothetical protein